jgi:hypothetical protein
VGTGDIKTNHEKYTLPYKWNHHQEGDAIQVVLGHEESGCAASPLVGISQVTYLLSPNVGSDKSCALFSIASYRFNLHKLT